MRGGLHFSWLKKRWLAVSVTNFDRTNFPREGDLHVCRSVWSAQLFTAFRTSFYERERERENEGTERQRFPWVNETKAMKWRTVTRAGSNTGSLQTFTGVTSFRISQCSSWKLPSYWCISLLFIWIVQCCLEMLCWDDCIASTSVCVSTYKLHKSQRLRVKLLTWLGPYGWVTTPETYSSPISSTPL